jgi:PPIC-type PPIASE domain
MNRRTGIFMLVALTPVLSACADSGPPEPLVASVDGYRLSVDDAVDLLVNEEQLPAQTALVESLARLWINYTLLAEAAVEDSTFASLDFEPLVRQQLDQLMIFQLRDSVIEADTAIADAELSDMYATEAPDLQLRARHILFQFPPQASAEERDTVRARLERVRQRALRGESFANLARQFSQDRGSAALGGDLGFFSRGDMVAPFENAVLAMEPGGISPIVETPFGLHVIKLEERRVQGFDDVASDYRTRVQTQRLLAAESTYVAAIEATEDPQPVEDAYAIARELARDPGTRLSSRAGRRPIFEYGSGALTVARLQGVLQSQPAELLQQVAEGEDAQIDAFLRGLVQREILLARAREAGLEPPQERVDSLIAGARDQLRLATNELGLVHPDQAPGEPIARAINRSVREALGRILSGGAEVVQLGRIGYQLRQGTAPTISQSGVGQAVLAIGQRRARRSPSLLENAVDSSAAASDTASR